MKANPNKCRRTNEAGVNVEPLEAMTIWAEGVDEHHAEILHEERIVAVLFEEELRVAATGQGAPVRVRVVHIATVFIT